LLIAKRCRLDGILPNDSVKKAARLWRVRVVETPSVKVFWESSIRHMFLN
jgi:hypothetical protein